GDIAPLEELAALTRSRGARLIVDEAHATGCVGPGGRGAVAEAGLDGEEHVVVVGTLGKALGAYGAFVAGSDAVRELLVNTARPFIFSTAPPPPAVAGALAALELLEEQPARVGLLGDNARTLRDELAREGFDVAGSSTQIIPIVVGDAVQAMAICEAALARGVFAQAIRPPTVPDGTSRLRLAVMASHTKEELREAARTLGRAALQAGFRPADRMPVAAAGRPAIRVA
ncbi:MAG: aminotransferase class I/II-fold pyridoxal phosphate-dependent enzyme, partial [Actinomycetota bacterium]|nr:aminotransferase class I/II-fold pyridoxal phosphate-dependent enzyme [Actinomycetota bacterium]